MSDSLEYLERTTAGEPTHSVIWLHGLGADGFDFEPIVPQFKNPQLPAVRFVFPHAPVRPVSLNNGMPMRAWYDIYSLDREAREDIDGIKATRHLIYELIARENQRGIPCRNIALAGFSQGCAMALYTGLRLAESIAGIVALSGYLPLRNTTAAERHPANADTRVFMAHGLYDPVVAISFAEASRDTMRALGQPVDWHSYPMDHSLHPQELLDIESFLVEVFTANAD